MAAARRIVHGTAHPFDVGGFGEREYFAYIAAFGAFTEVSYATPQSQKKVLGHLAYVLQGALALPKIESYKTRVEYDEGVIEGDFSLRQRVQLHIRGGAGASPGRPGLPGGRLFRAGAGEKPRQPAEFKNIVDSVLYQKYDSEDLLILHTRRANSALKSRWPDKGRGGRR